MDMESLASSDAETCKSPGSGPYNGSRLRQLAAERADVTALGRASTMQAELGRSRRRVSRDG